MNDKKIEVILMSIYKKIKSNEEKQMDILQSPNNG